MNEEVFESYNKEKIAKGFMGIFILSDTKKMFQKLPLKIYLRNKLVNLIGNQKLIKRVEDSLPKFKYFVQHHLKILIKFLKNIMVSLHWKYLCGELLL